jgi:hypothetical protein
MSIIEIQIGDRLVHRSNPLLSGYVCGVDRSGPVRPSGPCVWIDHHGRARGFWRLVNDANLADYDIYPTDEDPTP